MWPFSYIPDTIDPTIRKLIIFLITVQFLSFVCYMIILIDNHKKNKIAAKKIQKSNDLKLN